MFHHTRKCYPSWMRWLVVCVNIIIMVYGPLICVGSAIIFVFPMCLIKFICICITTSGGGSRGGGGFTKQCSVKNVLCHYLYTILPYKIRILEYFRSHLSIFLFPFSFHLGRGGHPSLSHPRSLLRVSNNE